MEQPEPSQALCREATRAERLVYKSLALGARPREPIAVLLGKAATTRLRARVSGGGERFDFEKRKACGQGALPCPGKFLSGAGRSAGV